MSLSAEIRHAAAAGSSAVTASVDAALSGDYDGFSAALNRFSASGPVTRIASRISANKDDFDAFADGVGTNLASLGIDRDLFRMLALAVAGGLLLTSTAILLKIVGLLLLIKLALDLYDRSEVLIARLGDMLERYKSETF